MNEPLGKQNNVPPENLPQPPSQKTSPVIGWLMISLLIITIILLVGFSIWMILKDKTTNPETVGSEQTKSKAIDDSDPNFQILSPKSGDVLCLENRNFISWSVPEDVSSVVLSLNTSTSANRIGEFPAVQDTSNGVGYGKVAWNMSNEYGYTVEGSDVYFLSMTAFQNGKHYQARTDGIFSVKKCQEGVGGVTDPKMFDDSTIKAFLVSDIATAQNPINAGKAIDTLISVISAPCSGKPIINASPDQKQRAIFRRSCDNPDVYFCLDTNSKPPYGGFIRQVDEAYVNSGLTNCASAVVAPGDEVTI